MFVYVLMLLLLIPGTLLAYLRVAAGRDLGDGRRD